MKHVVALFILAMSSTVLSAEVVRKVSATDTGVVAVYYSSSTECAREVFDHNGRLVTRTGTIPDGKVTQYDRPGVVLYEYTYKDNRKDGVIKKYADDGKLRQEMTYRFGRRSGITREYGSDGKVRKEYQYEAGVLNGPTKIYQSDGKLFQEITYRNDAREGPSTTYYESGRPGEVANYTAGKRDGLTKVYYDVTPEKIQYLFTYQQGTLIKKAEYNLDGTPVAVPAGNP